MANVYVERVTTAIEFLKALSPWDGFCPADYRKGYIFRGAGSSKYNLMPSAFRKEAILRSYENSVSAPMRTVGDQIRAEATTLLEFFLAADRQGLHLPEDSQNLRELYEESISVKDDWIAAIAAGMMPWPSN